MSVAHSHFGQNRLQQLAVGFRQSLPEDARGDSNHEFAVFSALLPGGPEPCRETVGINPPFHVLQNFFPGIHCLKNLKKARMPTPDISTTVEMLWKLQPQDLPCNHSLFLG
jgi:hypothetical protein